MSRSDALSTSSRAGVATRNVARSPDLQVWVGSVTPSPIGGFVLPVQSGFEFFQDRIRVGEFCKACACEKLRLLPIPSLPADQVIIQWAILAGSIKVQGAGLDGRGNVPEKEYLAKRNPEPLWTIRNSIAFDGCQERQGHAGTDIAILFAEMRDGNHEIRHARIANERDPSQDRADPVLQANGTVLEDLMEMAVVGSSALADVGPQEIHDTFLVAIENGPYAVYGPAPLPPRRTASR